MAAARRQCGVDGGDGGFSGVFTVHYVVVVCESSRPNITIQRSRLNFSHTEIVVNTAATVLFASSSAHVFVCMLFCHIDLLDHKSETHPPAPVGTQFVCFSFCGSRAFCQIGVVYELAFCGYWDRTRALARGGATNATNAFMLRMRLVFMHAHHLHIPYVYMELCRALKRSPPRTWWKRWHVKRFRICQSVSRRHRILIQPQ